MSELIDFYSKEGYLVIPKGVGNRDMRHLRREMEELQMAVEAGVWRGNHLMEGPGRARVVFNPYDQSPTLRSVVDDPELSGLVKAMLGGVPMGLHHSKLMCKPALAGTPQPPHQDFHYWQGKKANQVGLFICIDSATEENGCLRIFGGSHKEGLLPHHEEHHEVTGERHWVCNVSPDMACNEVLCEGQPGDMILFSSLTVHWSAANRSARHRRGVILEFDELGNLPPSYGWGAPEPAREWS